MSDYIRWTEAIDSLKNVTWVFWIYDTNLVLDAYIIETRPTRRHHFKVEAEYQRLRSSLRGRQLDEKNVPLTDEIREKALRKFTDQLRVLWWSEFKKT
jgi:hypothetical protein